MTERKFGIGDMLKDKITGFKGTVIAFTVYGSGCVNYCLQPAMNTDDTKIPDTEWLDQNRLNQYDSITNKKPIELTDKEMQSDLFSFIIESDEKVLAAMYKNCFGGSVTIENGEDSYVYKWYPEKDNKYTICMK